MTEKLKIKADLGLRYVRFGMAVLWSFFIAAVCLPGMLISRRFAHWAHRLWARVVLLILGIEVEVENLAVLQRPSLVIAPNHSSMFDIFVLASLPIEFSWIAKAEVGKIPIIGRCMRTFGCHLVRRDGKGGDIHVMKTVEETLRAGARIAIFPEGTRSRDGGLLPFKKGAFRVAQNAQVAILPVALQGTFELAQNFPPSAGQRVRVLVGEPRLLSQNEELDHPMSQFRTELQQLLSQPISPQTI